MKQCSWGECKEPATQIARWSNESPKKKNEIAQPAKPTLASYCDMCIHEATKHGAVHVGPYFTCDCGAQSENPTGPWQHKRGCAVPGPHNDGSKHLTLVK